MKPRIPLHLRPPAKPPKRYNIPALRPARFRIPTEHYLHPFHYGPAVCDTRHGIEIVPGRRWIPLETLARSRPTQRMLKALAANFGA